jgi:hypothetical protein
MLLTRDQVQEALVNCPTSRHDIRDGLWGMLSLMKRGIEIKDTAPLWIQAQNVIFVSKIDGGDDEPEQDN